MLKKIVSISLSVLILVSVMTCMAGCSGGSGKVKWAVSWFGQEEEKQVLEVFNKRLEELLPGVQLEFVEFNSQKWTQQMAAGEVMDIAWTGYSVNMDAEIANGSYMALNDLITEEKTPNLWKEWKDTYKDDYESATVNGKLYAIPNEQPLISESVFLKIPASLMEYFNVDAFLKATYASPTTTREVYEVLDDFFEKAWAANAVDTDTVTKCVDIQNLYTYLGTRGYTAIDKNSHTYFKTFAEGNPVIVSLPETEEYKLFMEYAVKWYKDGYIAKNVLVNGGAAGSRLPPITMHLNGMWNDLDDPERGIRNVYDTDGNIEQYYINVEPKDYSHKALGPSVLGSESTYCAIPYTSKNAEKALQLLDLLRSPVGTEGNDLLNLLVYGFEKNSAEAKEYGTYHYTLDGTLAIGNGYTLQPDHSVPYGKPHWVIGNVFLTYRTPNILEGQNEYAMEYQEKSKSFHKTSLYNFRSDISKLSVEVGNVNSAYEEFHDRLICGVDGDNYMQTYNDYLKKLKDGGMDKIISEIQKQADAFVAKNAQ